MPATYSGTLYSTTNDLSPVNDMTVATGVASDSVDLAAGVARGIFCSAAGNIQLTTAGGTTVVIAIPATATGTVIPIRVKRLWTTSTTIALASLFLCY